MYFYCFQMAEGDEMEKITFYSDADYTEDEFVDVLNTCIANVYQATKDELLNPANESYCIYKILWHRVNTFFLDEMSERGFHAINPKIVQFNIYLDLSRMEQRSFIGIGENDRKLLNEIHGGDEHDDK